MLTGLAADDPLLDGSAALDSAALAAALGAATLGAALEAPLLHAATRTAVAAQSARYRPDLARSTLLLLHVSPWARTRTGPNGPDG
jgi:hypothetical protein